MTNINDISDLVRILRENPDWTDILRGILLSRELLELPTKFPELVAAVAELTAGQAELRAGPRAELRAVSPRTRRTHCGTSRTQGGSGRTSYGKHRTQENGFNPLPKAGPDRRQDWQPGGQRLRTQGQIPGAHPRHHDNGPGGTLSGPVPKRPGKPPTERRSFQRPAGAPHRPRRGRRPAQHRHHHFRPGQPAPGGGSVPVERPRPDYRRAYRGLRAAFSG